jgi:outer membrane protein assembly factor BamA
MRFLLIFCFLLSSTLLWSQKQFQLSIVENPDVQALKKIKYTKAFSTYAERDKEVRSVLIALWNNGYLAAKTDSIRQDSTAQTVYINPGQLFNWAVLHPGNVDEEILNFAGYRRRNFRGDKFKVKEVARIQERILVWCENNGYPFAAVRLDSVQIEKDRQISASLSLTKNRFTKIDSIQVKGNLKTSEAFLYNYIGVAPGDPYDESKIAAISPRLRELAFARETQAFTILFTEKYTKLTLFLDRRKAGQFDGIVGILPDNNTGKVLFTGDVRLKLQNSLRRGELIELNWRRLQSQTQDLKARISYPYLFRTPAGVDYQIKLYRRDTSFLHVQQLFGLQYVFTGSTAIRAYVKNTTSSLLSVAGLENITTLPSTADISAISYGLGFHIERVDYRFNPRMGFIADFSWDIGTRTIKQNPGLNPLIYEGLKLKTTAYSSTFNLEKFWPLGRRTTIMTGVKSAWQFNSGFLLRNELFRIGGLTTLRGFDEESIFASSYAVATIEYRFLLEQNSWFFAFFDQGWYENNSKDTFITDRPYGFGTGVTFETKAGIFALTYALGSQFSQPIQFRSGKIHVGFIGLF